MHTSDTIRYPGIIGRTSPMYLAKLTRTRVIPLDIDEQYTRIIESSVYFRRQRQKHLHAIDCFRIPSVDGYTNLRQLMGMRYSFPSMLRILRPLGITIPQILEYFPVDLHTKLRLWLACRTHEHVSIVPELLHHTPLSIADVNLIGSDLKHKYSIAIFHNRLIPRETFDYIMSTMNPPPMMNPMLVHLYGDGNTKFHLHFEPMNEICLPPMDHTRVITATPNTFVQYAIHSNTPVRVLGEAAAVARMNPTHIDMFRALFRDGVSPDIFEESFRVWANIPGLRDMVTGYELNMDVCNRLYASFPDMKQRFLPAVATKAWWNAHPHRRTNMRIYIRSMIQRSESYNHVFIHMPKRDIDVFMLCLEEYDRVISHAANLLALLVARNWLRRVRAKNRNEHAT